MAKIQSNARTHDTIRRYGKIACLLLVAACSSNAFASGTLFRSYLSVNGSDSNSCTLQAPCRLLPAALASTVSGGEIWMLDSANYNTGTVSITQSVTILAVPGALGSVVVNNGNALEISAPAVTLRNLVFKNLAGTGYSGILTLAGTVTSLKVEDSHFSQIDYGIYHQAIGAPAIIKNTVFEGGIKGITVIGFSGNNPSAAIDQCTFQGAGQTGFGVDTIYGEAAISHSYFAGLQFGVHVGDHGNVIVQDNVFSLDGTSIFMNTAAQYAETLYSFGNNTESFSVFSRATPTALTRF